MGYYVSNIIAIRTGGVFSSGVDENKLKELVKSIVPELPMEVDVCMSKELVANKGSYVVIAGVFNYWTWDQSSKFSENLSAKLGDMEVVHTCWDEEKHEVQVQIFLAGKPIIEINEHPLGRVLRRIG